MAEKFFNLRPLFVTAANAGMPVLIDTPSEAGSDRLVNAVAAYEKYGGPCIIVDFGTGTNFDVVSKHGEFIGGVICPGIQISADALFQRAARLYRVDIRHPEKVIGTNTTACLQSGLYFGSIGLVDGILERMIEELGDQPKVIATGGLASLIGKGSRLIETIDQDLTLEGLRMIYQRQQGAHEN
jgi:type III pantothenate kinase